VLLPSRILGGTVTTPVQVKAYRNKRAILPSSATIKNMNTLYAILDLLAAFIYSVKRSPSALTTSMLVYKHMILRNTHPLLGNDSETSNYTTAHNKLMRNLYWTDLVV
jgi:hypothetical protein